MTTAPKVVLPILAILVAVLGGLFALKSMVPARPPAAEGQFELKVGAVTPDFVLKRFEGDEMKFSEVQGKLFLVNFWATWCEACMVEMPSISKLREKYRDRGFEVLAVNLDENPQAAVTVARERLGVKFPIFLDQSNDLSDLFDVHGIPLTVILDRKGKVLLVETGERDWFGKDILENVEGWLSQ